MTCIMRACDASHVTRWSARSLCAGGLSGGVLVRGGGGVRMTCSCVACEFRWHVDESVACGRFHDVQFLLVWPPSWPQE